MVLDLKFIQIIPFLKDFSPKVKLTVGVEVLPLKVKYIKDHFALTQWVEKVFSNGQMEDYILESFPVVKDVVKVYICGQTAKYTMENSKMMIAMELVNFIILMVNVTKATGKMVKNTEKASTFGQMVQNMLLFIQMERKRRKENWMGLQFPWKNWRKLMVTSKKELKMLKVL